ncbi:MAG: DUF116 domain-containing protein [Candidatus Cloacimonadaceae bacterium]|nr:DUF116 domain-containing protein [Candidatus Cloacimonadaceae bacterium]
MKEHYFSVIKFPVFVSLCLIILTVTFFGVALHSYFQLGLSVYSTLIYSVLFVILSGLISTWILTLMATHQIIRPKKLRLYVKWMLFNIYYYFAKWLAKITLQDKTLLHESFLHFNNEIVLTNNSGIKQQNILMILPHCLQNSDCKIRITYDINDCEECGNCNIADVKKVISNYKIKSAIATGGSLARKVIKDTDPDVIIAVACHRDLVDGVRESWRYPVYALLNERPKGPCFDTTVSVKAIEFAINKFS